MNDNGLIPYRVKHSIQRCTTFTYKNRIQWRKQRNFLLIGKNLVKNGGLSKSQMFYLKMP